MGDIAGMSSRLHRGGQALRTARAGIIARAAGGPIVCARCGGIIDPGLSGLHPQGLTVGHRIAASRGGTDDPGNLVPEHRDCNMHGKASPSGQGTQARSPRADIASPVPTR